MKTILFLLLTSAVVAQEGMTASEIYMLTNQNPKNMKYENGDIVELMSGAVCMVNDPSDASANVRCVDIHSGRISYPLHVEIRKVLKRYAQIKRTRNAQFRFTLVGDNGEIIGTSETYKTKAKALNTVKQYHPSFKIVDKT